MALNVETPLSDEDRALWTGRIKEARQAYHDIATGQALASFTDQNGERAQFTKADMGTLAAYINDMVALLGTPTTPLTAKSPRPLRYIF